MRQSRKTLVLWAVLIVIFVALYQLLRTPGGKHERVCETNWSTVAITWSVPALSILGLVLWVRWQQRRFSKGHEGIRLMGEGRNAQALELFERARAAESSPLNVFNCAVVELVLWKLDAAMTDFAQSKQLRGVGEGNIAAIWSEHFALACALVGRVDDGLEAIAHAPKEATPSRRKLAEGALLTRARRWAEARALLNALEVKQLGGSFAALARTLDAMRVEQLSGELRHVDRVGLFAEASTDEARRHWPELLAFVERAPAW